MTWTRGAERCLPEKAWESRQCLNDHVDELCVCVIVKISFKCDAAASACFEKWLGKQSLLFCGPVSKSYDYGCKRSSSCCMFIWHAQSSEVARTQR